MDEEKGEVSLKELSRKSIDTFRRIYLSLLRFDTRKMYRDQNVKINTGQIDKGAWFASSMNRERTILIVFR